MRKGATLAGPASWNRLSGDLAEAPSVRGELEKLRLRAVDANVDTRAMGGYGSRRGGAVQRLFLRRY